VDYDSAEKRRERLRRRKLIEDWKVEARAIQAADPDSRMLMREAKAVALKRIEDAARTVADFEDITRRWDNAQIVEGWRIEKHETLALNDTENQPLPEYDTVIPAPLEHIWWRQQLGGNFLDVIFDCPHDVHELTSSRPVYEFTKVLDENHKEILYYRAIRQWTPQRVASLRGQTDRNIRKVYHRMIEDIRRKLYIRLYPRYVNELPLTHAQREFCETYPEQLDAQERAKLDRKLGDDKRRGWGESIE
jgi:hypothetical protein